MKKIILVLFTLISVSALAQKEHILLKPAAFGDSLLNNLNIQLVDVRTTDEFNGGHIALAKNMEIHTPAWNDFEKMDITKPVFVYCQSGNRSGQAAQKLVDKGFTVYDLEGGMRAWRSAQMPEVLPNNLAASSSFSLEDFKSKIKQQKYTLVQFEAPWCTRCQETNTYLQELMAKNKKKINFVSINLDSNKTMADALNVSALPTIRVYKNGKEKASLSGEMDNDGLNKLLKKF